MIQISDEVVLIFAGVFGGLARALYGFLKAEQSHKQTKPGYFIQTLITSGIIGGIVASLFDTGIAVTAMVGYVGSDILDNIINAISPRKIEMKKGSGK